MVLVEVDFHRLEEAKIDTSCILHLVLEEFDKFVSLCRTRHLPLNRIEAMLDAFGHVTTLCFPAVEVSHDFLISRLVLCLKLVTHRLFTLHELVVDIYVEAVSEKKRILALARPRRLKVFLVSLQDRLEPLHHVASLRCLETTDERSISQLSLVFHVPDLVLQ